MPKTTNTTRYARYKFYSQNAIYHIYNRGNSKQNIFIKDVDYQFYLGRLKKYLDKHNVSLITYALMPNHIHLLARQKTPIPIYKFMSSLHTSYSMYFNKKYDHVGHLFQDRFKQVIVDSDEQLLHLTRYIHLNPVEANLVKDLEDYPWTSYREYIGDSSLSICTKDIIMELMNANKENLLQKYREFCRLPITDRDNQVLEEIVLEPF